jgi:hypothetical protein
MKYNIMKLVFVLILLCNHNWSIAEKKYIWLQGIEYQDILIPSEIADKIFKNSNYHIIEYSSDRSINRIAISIYENHLKTLERNNEIILIGFGMGGLVARSLKNMSNSVIGIITIGTAHNGSVLLNNAMNGKDFNLFGRLIGYAIKAFDESMLATKDLTYPASTLTKPIMNPILYFKNESTEKTFTKLKETYHIATGLYGLNYISVFDLIPNSNYIKNINDVTLDVPLVNIYGTEDYWQVLRTISSFNNLNSQTSDEFEFDKVLFPQIYRALATIMMVQQTHNITYNSFAVLAKHFPSIWHTRESVLKARYNWDQIYRYIDVDIHMDFAVLMGAIEQRYMNFCTPLPTDIKQLKCTMKYLPFTIENDGIYSRFDMTFKAKSSSRVYNLNATGLNHSENSNHHTIKNIIQKIVKDKQYGHEFSD